MDNNQYISKIFSEVLTYEGLDTDTSGELQYPFPCCNHVKGITAYNAGYARGFLNDTIPFEAEVFTNADAEIWLAVVMPASLGEDRESMMFEVTNEKEWNLSVLPNNMKLLGTCEDYLLEYTDMLVENEIFTMDSGRVPSFAKYFLDNEDNLMVQVFIALMDEEGILNYSDLDIIEF